jgi:hypothetical protein
MAVLIEIRGYHYFGEHNEDYRSSRGGSYLALPLTPNPVFERVVRAPALSKALHRLWRKLQ